MVNTISGRERGRTLKDIICSISIILKFVFVHIRRSLLGSVLCRIVRDDDGGDSGNVSLFISPRAFSVNGQRAQLLDRSSFNDAQSLRLNKRPSTSPSHPHPPRKTPNICSPKFIHTEKGGKIKTLRSYLHTKCPTPSV